jgi:hypothetical protein
MLTPLVLGGGDDERTQERPADEMAVFLSQAGAADGGAKGIDLIGDRSEVVRLQRISEPRAFRPAGGGGGRDIGAASDRALCPGRLGSILVRYSAHCPGAPRSRRHGRPGGSGEVTRSILSGASP